MKNTQRILIGLCVTLIVFAIASLGGGKIHLESSILPYSFVTHSLMLLFSILLIYGFKKAVNYKIALPSVKNVLKVVAISLGITMISHISGGIFLKIIGVEENINPVTAKMSAWQVLVFVFIYASIAEEMLFRGFLLNFLSPLKSKGITLFKRTISLPVIISGLAFGCSHLVLATTEVGVPFLVYVVVFTTILGLVAGYYQEKYNNNAFAILVHMTGNSPAVIVAFLMALK